MPQTSCPRRTRSCLDARHGSEQNRTEDIDKYNPDWQRYEVKLEEHIGRNIIKEFAPAFKNKSDQNTYFAASKPVRITINKEANPVYFHVTNKIPAGMHQYCHNLIDRLLGKIKRWDKPMKWCALARFVRKSNGSPFLVVNDQGLNVAGQRLGYPFTSANKVNSMMDIGAEQFICFNLTDAYFQIKVAEGSEYLHACMAPLGKANTTAVTTSISKQEICWQGT